MILQPHAPHLGLVCITDSDEVRYRAMTRKRLLSLSAGEQVNALRNLYSDNLQRLNTAIDFCHRHNIRLYRFTSKLLPFADMPIGRTLLPEFHDVLARSGRRATALGIRLVVHPEQYVVLNSTSPDVVANSHKILAMHGEIMDRLEQPRTSWAAINIHGGKGGRSDELVDAIRSLPDAIRLRLTLENDEHIYSADEILAVCDRTSVPMIFDAHHHVCHEKLLDYEDASLARAFLAARETWPHPEWQIVHISNGRDAFGDRSHHDLIEQMPPIFQHAPWIEVEAKRKEVAIEKLRTEWLGQEYIAHCDFTT